MFETILTITGIAGLANALTWARPFREALNLLNLDDMAPLDNRFIINDGFFGVCSRNIWLKTELLV